MFSRNSSTRYGLLVDIGSGSVGLAICKSANDKQPFTIWSHREHVPLRNIEAISDSSKAIVTTLLNVMMTYESEGRAALENFSKGAKINTMQATIAAPWAYTTTRTIKFEQDEPFEINQELVDDLAAAAGQQAIDEFSEQHSLESLGITETSRCVLDTYANGYRLSQPNQQKAKVVTLTHATTLIRNEIIEAVTELNQKLFGKTPLKITSYMLANYFATRLLIPHIYDVCLVDITDEATEIGIVRDGSLQYSTHTPFGRASLAREISAATKVPLQEAFNSFPTQEGAQKNPELEAIYTAYIQRVYNLFQETGDRLTIPKNIYIEADTGLAAIFEPLILEAGVQASKSQIKITKIKETLDQTAKKNKISDTPLFVAGSFFHTSRDRRHFEYL